MNKQQELWMSTRERERLKVLHEAEKGHLTQKQAGAQLKLSERWVRKLVGRLRKEGDGGILHRLRGRASKQKLSAAKLHPSSLIIRMSCSLCPRVSVNPSPFHMSCRHTPFSTTLPPFISNSFP